MTNYHNRKRLGRVAAVAIICIIVFSFVLFAVRQTLWPSNSNGFDTSQDFIEFFDVGQGDCALIYSNGYCAMIDVGLPNTANELSEQLTDYGIDKLDVVVISHLHSDHVGGLPHIAERFEIENLIMPKVYDKSILSAKNGKQAAVAAGAAAYDAKQGMSFEIGEFEITVLSDFEDSSNENNRSLFVMAELDDNKVLFTGDAEAKAEKKLLEQGIDVDCDILKVGHHGSNTSSSSQFLNQATPEYSVISVGEGNMYHHPHNATLTALEGIGSKIFRTEKDGDVTFSFNSGKIIPSQEK